MLIRSQDKLQLVPLEIGSISAGYRDSEDNKRVYFYDTGSSAPSATLGLYSTREKVIKVLDMIQEFYNSCFTFSMEDDGCYHEASLSKVFQMPQDSEVWEL